MGIFNELRVSIFATCGFLTAERVFFDVREYCQAQRLLNWAAFLRWGDELIEDVCSSRRHVGARFVRMGGRGG